MRMKVSVQRPVHQWIGRWLWSVHCPSCVQQIYSVQHDTPAPANEYAIMHAWQHGGLR